MAKQNSKANATYKMTKLKLNTCSEIIFIMPVSEDELEKVMKNLKGKPLAGIEEVRDLIVQKCMKVIKKHLTILEKVMQTTQTAFIAKNNIISSERIQRGKNQLRQRFMISFKVFQRPYMKRQT